MLRLVRGAAVLGLFSCALRAQSTGNDGVHLAVGPSCGSAKENVTDVNEGLRTVTTYKTIVSFGDSYTSGGVVDGTAQRPAIVDYSSGSPKAGGRTTNGPVWIEDIATDIGATFMDYAIGGAVTDVALWPSKANHSDFVSQSQAFPESKPHFRYQNYAVYGILCDYSASSRDGDHLPEAAQVVLDQMAILASPPTNATSFLVTDAYGRESSAPSGEAYKQKIFDGLRQMRKDSHHIRYAFADFKNIWDAVLGPTPGYQAFGYTSTGACTQNSSSLADLCSTPETTFYWIPGHPSKETHRIMGDYTKLVLDQC